MPPISVKITKHSGKPREWRIWWDVGWIVFSSLVTSLYVFTGRYVSAIITALTILLWVWLLHIDLNKFEWTITEEEYTLTGKEEKNEDTEHQARVLAQR
jgi:hypothetical protein